MRWPWCSRELYDEAKEQVVELRERSKTMVMASRLDDAKDENAWLRARVEDLEDRIGRVDRFRSGMTETPRETLGRELKPMPDEFADYFDGLGTPSIQKELRDRAFKRHSRGEDWEDVMDDMMPLLEEEHE